MSDKPLYLPWKSNDETIVCSTRLDLLSEVGVIYRPEVMSHVIKVVNCHDELVEALKEITSLLENARLKEFHMDTLNKAKQALSKIEGIDNETSNLQKN
jgi:hypothetical protein